MNKVFNWTVGSFFRTIGRMLAFFIVGIAIAYILAQSDLKIGNIFRYTLGVHASTFDSRWINGVEWKKQGGTYTGASLTSDLIWQFRLDNAGANRYLLKFYEHYTFTNGKELTFNIKFRVNENEELTLTSVDQQFQCNISNTEWSWYQGSNGDSVSDYDHEFEYKSFTCNSHYINTSGTLTEYKFGLSLQYWFNDNEDLRAPCYAKANAGDTYTFTCPANQYNNINGIIVQVSTPFQTDVTIGVADLFTIETDTTQAIIDAQHENTQAITNQTQQDQQQHEEMMDSNTTQAEDDAQDFFESFDAPDIGGLSAIITAPLSTIQSLLNATCTNLVLPLPFVNKNLTLPCMNDIYTQHFGAFFSLYQTIILGIIAYRCIRSIFFDLQGFANPSDDRIEVMDL